ncbi:MAG: hypothetical protein Q7W55_03840 [Pseudohongiella sp.]|nr:hypothetical protein [Pseudohongiella sp.]MDO9522033.1 hypothetical protein [Pseudohongiella sp.]MDP2128668.1 hypothetical protein [Pseudohongiella sp.]
MHSQSSPVDQSVWLATAESLAGGRILGVSLKLFGQNQFIAGSQPQGILLTLMQNGDRMVLIE